MMSAAAGTFLAARAAFADAALGLGAGGSVRERIGRGALAAEPQREREPEHEAGNGRSKIERAGMHAAPGKPMSRWEASLPESRLRTHIVEAD
jgi:hypothetical protein